MSHNVGRHRAPARYNPIAEIGQIVSQAGTPLAKGTAVIAASGGLVAAIAIPAQAANSAPEADATPVASAAAPAAPVAAVTAPSATSETKSTVSAFGKIEVEPVAKPTGPTPWQLRMREERERERAEAAAEREREQQAAAEQQEQQEAAPEREQESAPSRSEERSAPEPASEPAAPAPSSSASGVIAIAKQYIGVPYVYGGSSPSGFDCSGFTQYVFGKAGKSLPRVTTAQQAATTPVSDPQPGDLVFFGSPAYHVGIYLGDGMMIDAPSSGKSISIRAVFSGVSGYGRV